MESILTALSPFLVALVSVGLVKILDYRSQRDKQESDENRDLRRELREEIASLRKTQSEIGARNALVERQNIELLSRVATLEVQNKSQQEQLITQQAGKEELQRENKELGIRIELLSQQLKRTEERNQHFSRLLEKYEETFGNLPG